MAKQSKQDRLRRLSNGWCPVHGMWMPHVDNWYDEQHRRHLAIVECPRRDCDIRALVMDYSGPWEIHWEIHPDFAYVIDEAPE